MNNYVCSLSIRRNLAPAKLWHWSVERPDGSLFSVSQKSCDSLPAIMENAATDGVAALIRAECEQARQDPAFAKAIGWKA